MRITIEAEIADRRSGIAVRAPQLRLAGHGEDKDTALHSLRGAVNAWVVGLLESGQLARAVQRSGVGYDPEGEDVEILFEMVADA